MKRQDADKAILRILDVQSGQSVPACPNANELAAYLEASLTPGEMARFEVHAAECSACREALALSMQMTHETEGPAISPAPEARKPSYRTSPLRLAFVGSLVVIAGVLLFQATRQIQTPLETGQVADKQARSDISGGTGAVMRSSDVKTDKEALSSAPGVAAYPDSTSQARGMEERKSSAPPTANPAISAAAPAQMAYESGNMPRAQALDRIEESRLRSLVDQASETEKARRSQGDAQSSKMEMTARPAETKAQPGQVAGTSNQMASPANVVAPSSNIASIQNTQMAQVSNIANQMTQRDVQIDRKAAVDPGRAAQGRAAIVQAGAGERGGVGGQKGAFAMLPVIVPMEVKVLSNEVAAGFARKLGNRVFYQVTRYWFDAECGRHTKAPVREISWRSGDFSEILRKEPELVQLRNSGIPILIHWNGINYLVR
jgi:hypothetical protein